MTIRIHQGRVLSVALAALLGASAGCGDNITWSQVPDSGVPDGSMPDGGDPDSGAPLYAACPDPATREIACPDKGSFPDARAHWLRADVIALPADASGETFELHHADCGLRHEDDALLGSEGMLALTEADTGLDAELRARHPHLAAYRAFRVAPEDAARAAEILRGQLVVAARDADGAVLWATRVQIPGVIDELFTHDGPLGVALSGAAATFRLWAPTARWVCLRVHDRDTKDVIATADMTRSDDGVWSVTSAPDDDWYGHYYTYEVYVYAPTAYEYPDQAARTVTDPYSVGLSQNSKHSLIIDLDDPMTKPEGWDSMVKPPLAAPEDIVIYEGHIRDVSIHDERVPAAHRGTYLAFIHDGMEGRALSHGMSHLKALQAAGLTHFHVLPSFDIATVNEDPAQRIDLHSTFDDLCARNTAVPAATCMTYAGWSLREVLESLDPEADEGDNAQRIVGYMRDLDSFNWGYDPFHYNAPEGSYATESDGVARIVEFRAMVQALARNGLRIALDVVYNHTNASGLADKSVLDKIVPGYYHRLHAVTGEVERSTCCENTATEHRMMEKLMIDSLLVWARHYRADAFRFDLMGHHMKANMLAARQALAQLTLEADGVDGASIYLYGEGWNFGEVVNDTRGENATQLNMAGTGIGTFSDRLRDAVRGGGPFDSGEALRRNQGFISGMYYDPNEKNSGTDEERDTLLLQSDQIRVGMAGNLRDFVLVDREGYPVRGSSVCYGTAPAGYTDDPQEVITYIDKHDNQTLWDISQYKIPTGTSMETRVRIHNLGASIVLLGQGVPFVHMGMDLLRSKSMERDSYDSGDWFNKVDFSYETNNWNVGLPRADKDGDNWSVIKPILADTSIRPERAHIEAAAAHFLELLRVRKSSPLFRLQTRDEILRRVDFHNTGPEQIPGLIAMSITDGACAGADLDPALDGIMVLINATDTEQTLAVPGVSAFELHPILAESADPIVRGASFDEATDSFVIPARTAAVFVQPQGQGQGQGLSCNDHTPTTRTCNRLLRDVYVRGTMNGWSAPEEMRLAKDPEDDTRYVADIPLAAETYMFKIADETWATYNWGSGSAVTPGGGPHRMVSGGGDMTLIITEAGTYRFELRTQDINQPTIAVTLVP